MAGGGPNRIGSSCGYGQKKMIFEGCSVRRSGKGWCSGGGWWYQLELVLFLRVWPKDDDFLRNPVVGLISFFVPVSPFVILCYHHFGQTNPAVIVVVLWIVVTKRRFFWPILFFVLSICYHKDHFFLSVSVNFFVPSSILSLYFKAYSHSFSSSNYMTVLFNLLYTFWFDLYGIFIVYLSKYENEY